MRLDLLAIELRLLGVGRENHDDVGPLGSLRGRVHGEAFFFGFGARGAAFWKADADADAAVAQIERVRVALRAVADDGDFLGLDESEVRGVVVIEICHFFLLGRVTAGI